MCSLGIEVERLEWGQSKGSGGRGEEEGGTFEGIFPFTASALLIFSLLSGCLVPDILLDPAEVRDEIQSADKKLKVAVCHFKMRGKWQLLFCGLLLIKLSIVLPPGGVIERTLVPFI